MATYKGGTKKLIEMLQTSETRICTETKLVKNKKVQQVVLMAGDAKQTLPGKRELGNEALSLKDQAETLSVEDMQRLAQRTGMNVTQIYHILNENKPHKAPRDLVLCAMLMRNRIPEAERVSHTLLRYQQTELYLESCDKNENCRNLVLKLCFDYANADNVCPVADWLVFTNSVILWLDSRLGEKLNIHMEPLEVGEPDYRFVDDYRELLQQWARQLEKVDRCNLPDYREALLKAYMDKQAQPRKSRTDTLRDLAEKAGYSDRNATFIFSKRPRPCSRELLIQFAIAMGCNLDETNLLLRQVPLPALYPNSALENAKDAEHVKELDLEGLGVVKRKER